MPSHLVAAITFGLLAVTGCGGSREPVAPVAGGGAVFIPPETDAEKVRAADIRILFVGNSHTSSHDLPNLVCEMIRFRRPGKTACARAVSVPFLDTLANDPTAGRELDAHPWTAVVLQAQKISASGKFDYPRDDGIAFATRAKARGANVFFFSEWGLKSDPANGPRHEAIYRAMAEQAGVEVAAVGRAWDLALAERPDLALHDLDGNHQSRLGAFLTGCVLVGRITGEDPSDLAAFPDDSIPIADRQFLARIAAKSLLAK